MILKKLNPTHNETIHAPINLEILQYNNKQTKPTFGRLVRLPSFEIELVYSHNPSTSWGLPL